MGKITKIEQQKNKSRVNIFVDDTFFCGLEKETAIIFGLKVGKFVDEAELQKVIDESESKRAFEKGADYLSNRMYSKKELIEKLIKKGFLKQNAEAACKKLEEYGYINDMFFAKTYVQTNSKYSKMVLQNKLKQKGISKDIISDALDGMSNDDEFELCKKYAEKYVKGKKMDTSADRQKLYASLARRGFGFDLIKKVSGIVIKGSDEDDGLFSE